MAVTAAITSLIAAITIAVCFYVFQSFLMKNQIQSTEFNLQVISTNMDDDLKNIIDFTTWCRNSGDVRNYLVDFQDQPRLPSFASDEKNLRPLALSTYDKIKEEFNKYSRQTYISRAIISTLNGNNFLQMMSAANASSPIAAKLVKESSFFPLS